jgi:multicopper oxidase
MSLGDFGGDAGDVRYPYYLINGRIGAAPRTFRARPGERARIRFINAGADTAFRVALGGHRMTVTHTDGCPVVPVTADALLIGMGERYDVVVTLGDGVFPLTALAEGKNAATRALVRTAPGEPPPAGVRPAGLDGALASYAGLRAAPQARLPARAPDVTFRLRLTGGMGRYDWGINGQVLDMARPGALRFLMSAGQRVRVVFANSTTIPSDAHPRPHFPARPGRPAQGHRDRPPRRAAGVRLRRRQPGAVDDPLPQPLPRSRQRRHDGPARLPDLTLSLRF